MLQSFTSVVFVQQIYLTRQIKKIVTKRNKMLKFVASRKFKFLKISQKKFRDPKNNVSDSNALANNVPANSLTNNNGLANNLYNALANNFIVARTVSH